jgi:uncharacterized protein involved in type VI secretion and phage assembly
MNHSLLDLLLPPGTTAPDRIFGVVIGIVTNNRDPEGMGRVRVRFPWLSESDESEWARMAIPMAGNDRGAYFLPEVEDEVLVAFEHGDIRFPYVLGALWNGQDKPPELNADGNNNMRTIKSRSGHIIRLDDTDGAEKIEIIDKTQHNSIIIDASANAITLKADGDLTLESAQGKIVIKGLSIEIQSTAKDVKVGASTNMDLNATAQMNIKGAMVNIN